MKFHLYFILPILLFSSALTQEFQTAQKPNFTGERLEFHMEYMHLHVATLLFEMEVDSENYVLSVAAKSTGKANFLFSLNNEYETRMEKSTLLPLWSDKKIRQKNISHDLKIKYDHSAGRASLADSVSWDIPQDCYDYFSMLYFFRTLSSHQLHARRFFLDSEYLISEVKAVQKSEGELVTVPAGQFSTIRLELFFSQQTREERPWKTDILTNRLAKPGSVVTIWFSDDDSRLPVKISYGNSLLKTSIELNSYSRGTQD